MTTQTPTTMNDGGSEIQQSEPGPTWDLAGTRAALVAAERALEAALTTGEQRRLVRDLRDAYSNFSHDEHMWQTSRAVDAIARHFPAFGPAIRAIAAHVYEDAGRYPGADVAECPLVRHDAPDFLLGVCDEGEEATS